MSVKLSYAIAYEWPMELLKIGKTASALQGYIEGRGLETDLANFHLQAAKEALSKAHLALDGRSQLWSVINHLESAESPLEKYISADLYAKAALRPVTLDIAKSNLIRVRMLMAACYIYLGEGQLAERSLVKAEAIIKRKSTLEGSELAGTFTAFIFLSPLILLDWLTKRGEPLGQEEIKRVVEPRIAEFRVLLGSASVHGDA